MKYEIALKRRLVHALLHRLPPLSFLLMPQVLTPFVVPRVFPVWRSGCMQLRYRRGRLRPPFLMPTSEWKGKRRRRSTGHQGNSAPLLPLTSTSASPRALVIPSHPHSDSDFGTEETARLVFRRRSRRRKVGRFRARGVAARECEARGEDGRILAPRASASTSLPTAAGAWSMCIQSHLGLLLASLARPSKNHGGARVNRSPWISRAPSTTSICQCGPGTK
ncbi:hypothetical protein C8R45DRAFT_88609 [Mycena sanguinolenta]|nr:hypothetical protein C8R45DRAFT_88609 [Mycena sanguinolenta]